MEQFKKINNIVGWVVFAFALFVYASTMESSASFWDCGEFIAGAYKLEVVHPPGAPLFLMVGRVFTLFAMGNVELVPVMVNFMSALCSAFAILFTFWSITMLAKKLVFKDGEYNLEKTLAVIGTGVVGALAGTFADSFWFSAVEGEVYAFSIFFLMFVIWAALKWEASDAKYQDKWLLLIAFSLGLSSGVHLLSLLGLPVIALIYYYKRHEFSWKGLVFALAGGFLSVFFFMNVIIIGIPDIGAQFDLLFVNSIGLPPWSGMLFWIVVLGIALIAGIYLTSRNQALNLDLRLFAGIIAAMWVVLTWGSWIMLILGGAAIVAAIMVSKMRVNNNTVILAITFALMGFSSYFMVPIRSEANPPINMNKPQDPFSFVSYLKREQYGDRPLLMGPNYTATQYDLADIKQTGKRYSLVEKDGKAKYEVVGYKQEYVWKEGVEGPFPRLGFWQENRHKNAYRGWLNPSYGVVNRQTGQIEQTFANNQKQAANQYADSKNQQVGAQLYAVTDVVDMGDNVQFFFKYQLGFMYFRYLMWNFAGRQNDLQGFYYNDDGRWTSGIAGLDENLFNSAGNPQFTQDNLPLDTRDNWGHNKFFMIPFLLGLVGMVFTGMRNPKLFFVMFLLFFIAGVLQIVYLNQPPIEPRERDYIYAGSFLAFAMFIGFAVMAIYFGIRKYLKGAAGPVIAVALCMVAPILMGTQGWDDHDRSGRFTARDFAVNYLMSCEPNAILFTQGDNDTYPLWYAQEVEGIRTDVRIVNLSLLGVDWYIEQLRHKINDADAIDLTFTQEQVDASNRDITRYQSNPSIPDGHYDLKEVMEFIANPENKKPDMGGELDNYLPTKKFMIETDSATVVQMGMVAPDDYGKIVKEMKWSIKQNSLLKNDLIALDIVANNIWKRPIYFAVSVSPDAYLNMDKYFQLEGLTYRIVPIENNTGNAQSAPVYADKMYENVMNEFKWGNMADPSVYIDEQIMRMTMNLRSNFGRLATELQRNGKNEEAIAVLDKANEVMPPDKVPINIFNMAMPEIYFNAGAPEKALNMMQLLEASALSKLDYMKQLPKSYANFQNDDVQRNLYILQSLMQIAERMGESEYSAALEEKLNTYSAAFPQGGPGLQ